MDTSKLGYAFGNGGFKKLVSINALSGDATGVLSSFYKGRTDTTIPYILFIVVKNLWLQDASLEELKSSTIVQTENIPIKRFGVCTARLEIYARQENLFTPLFRLDTSFRTDKLLLKEAPLLLALPFATCMQKAVSFSSKSAKFPKKQIKWKDILDYHDKRLAFPRFQMDSASRGMYRTFSDFLNNHLDTARFEVKSGAFSDELYTVEKDKKTVQDKIWGFCDGKKHYIRLGHNFYRLHRTGNTYEFWGSKYVIGRSQSLDPHPGSGDRGIIQSGITRAIARERSANRAHKPMQLDMETGKAF